MIGKKLQRTTPSKSITPMQTENMVELEMPKEISVIPEKRQEIIDELNID